MRWLDQMLSRFKEKTPVPVAAAVGEERANQSSQRGPKFLSDSPIGKDHFGRGPFARALAKALLLPPGSEGLVVGIEGVWGSGKSFAMNQVKSILQEATEAPIVVEFNPWVISGTDGLVEALLQEISAALGQEALGEIADLARKKAAVKAGSSILRYLSLVRHLKYLKYVPGAAAIGNAAEDLPEIAEKWGKAAEGGSNDLQKIADALPERSLEKRKDSAVAALLELKRPIVVILDDLDRLPSEEIRSVFQAVKAVANFPRTAYLLSYDPSVAAKALDSDMSVGLSYLEKIVQVQYPLPQTLPWRMHSFVRSKVMDAFADIKRELTEGEQLRFAEVVSYAARMCKTPRDIVRICNRLRISLPATVGEVDACDVVLLEAIGICEPSVAEAIRLWPEAFTETARVEFETFGQEFYFAQAVEKSGTEKTDGRSSRKEMKWRPRISGKLSTYTEGALRHLFPDDVDEAGTLRVMNWDRLYRFLALGPSESITEIQDLKELVADEKNLQTALSGDDQSALSILRAMELYHGELNIPDGARLVELLCSLALARLNKDGDWATLSGQYADVVEKVVRLVKARKELMERVIDIAPVSVSQALLTTAAKDLGLFPVGQAYEESPGARLIEDKSTYKQLIGRWVARIGEMFRGGVDFRNEPGIYVALHRIGQLHGDYRLPRDIAKRLVSAGDLKRFMRSTQLAGELGATYGHLDLVWDLQELVEAIERDPKNKTRYEKALGLLRSKESIDYFERRSTKPTLKWPPGGDAPAVETPTPGGKRESA